MDAIHIGSHVRLERVGQQEWLTLVMESRHESPSVAFIALSSILSVSLAEPDRHVDFLLNGQVLSVGASQAPTKLELGRRLSLITLGQTKLARVWNGQEGDDKIRAAGAMLVDVLPAVLKSIASDDTGQKALASITIIHLIAMAATEDLKAQLVGTELHLHFSSQLPLRSLADSLKACVESAL